MLGQFCLSGLPRNGKFEEIQKVVLVEELDLFKSMSELQSKKSSGNLTNESYSATLSTNSRDYGNHELLKKSKSFSEDKKVNLVKVEILSSCSSKDSFNDHSQSFCWAKIGEFDGENLEKIEKVESLRQQMFSNNQNLLDHEAKFPFVLDFDNDKENFQQKKAPLAPRNKNKISFNFDKKFLKEVNKKM